MKTTIKRRKKTSRNKIKIGKNTKKKGFFLNKRLDHNDVNCCSPKRNPFFKIYSLQIT
jgi:hypothetical protein